MFERYTEKARRVIFYSRYEAQQFGSPLIESEHLLVGLLREDKAIVQRFFGKDVDAIRSSIRTEVEKRTTCRGKFNAGVVDIPLSRESLHILRWAAQEADSLDRQHTTPNICPEHILLGLLREDRCVAAEILRERGLRLSAVHDEISRTRLVAPETKELVRNKLGDLLYSDCMISASQHNDEIFEAYRRGKESANPNEPTTNR